MPWSIPPTDHLLPLWGWMPKLNCALKFSNLYVTQTALNNLENLVPFSGGNWRCTLLIETRTFWLQIKRSNRKKGHHDFPNPSLFLTQQFSPSKPVYPRNFEEMDVNLKSIFLETPKPKKASAEFCQMLRSFLGQWSFKKKMLEWILDKLDLLLLQHT